MNNEAMKAQIGGDHYKGDKIQHFTMCMENGIPWAESSAMKYIMRHRKKNGVQDLDKAIHYLLMAREYYYPTAEPFTMTEKKPTEGKIGGFYLCARCGELILNGSLCLRCQTPIIPPSQPIVSAG